MRVCEGEKCQIPEENGEKETGPTSKPTTTERIATSIQ